MKGILLALALASTTSDLLEKADSYRENGLLDESRKILIEIAYSDGHTIEAQDRALQKLSEIARQTGNVALAEKISTERTRRFPPKGEPPTQSRTENQPPQAVSAEPDWPQHPAKVRLLFEGNEPRRLVRYDLSSLEKKSHEIAFATAAAEGTCPPTNPVHTANVRTSIQIESIERIGRSQVRAKWTGNIFSETSEGSGTRPTSGSLIFGSTGRLTLTQSRVDDAIDFIAPLLVEWPERPIGPGARWETETPHPLLPDQPVVRRFSVISISNDEVKLQVTIDGNFRARSGTARGRAHFSGGGTITWTSSGLFPSSQHTRIEGQVSSSALFGIRRSKACMSIEIDV